MGVKELRVELECNISFSMSESQPQEKKYYVLTSELLSETNVAKIQELILRSCILEPSVIDRFNCLKYLSISDVPLDEHEVESLISCCVGLESMLLGNCDLPLKLCISGTLPRLKFLSIYYCSGVEEIEVSAATLTTFEFAGYMIKFSISTLPNLQEVYFRPWDEKGIEYVFNQLGKDLPTVKTLSVLADTKWAECLPQHLTTLSNVKRLDFLCHRRVKFDALKMFRILNSCPLLEKLYICASIYEIEEMPTIPVHHKHLKEVHIGGFRLRIDYIEFALHMIEYADALERMVIDPQLKSYTGINKWLHTKKVTWDENKGEREAVCASLKDCSKSSLNVVSYLYLC